MSPPVAALTLDRYGSIESLLSLFSASASGSDDDPAFEKRRKQLDELDVQLRAMHKHLDGIDKHRRDLLASVNGFWGSVSSAAALPELPSQTFTSLVQLGVVETKSLALRDRLTAQYESLLAATLDEYIRTVQSARIAFSAR